MKFEWGVIRYQESVRASEQGRSAMLDSWYLHKSDAEGICKVWREMFPDCVVCLVKRAA